MSVILKKFKNKGWWQKFLIGLITIEYIYSTTNKYNYIYNFLNCEMYINIEKLPLTLTKNKKYALLSMDAKTIVSFYN